MSDVLARSLFRFAPSPNGRLHLGHAYSALLNSRAAEAVGGRFLLRIEDIDRTRSKRHYEEAIVADLAWLGLIFVEPSRRQSEHVADYARALASLQARGLVYPCFCTRSEIARASSGACDPDGAPLYPGACRPVGDRARQTRPSTREGAVLRLDMVRALALAPADLHWREYGEGTSESRIEADPSRWGDFVLKRRDMAASYHLAVVVDDGAQGVSDVMRGADLFQATSVHRLLQELLAIAAPRYRHHRLVRDAVGEKMSKSASSTTLEALRRAGVGADKVRAALGFGGASSGVIAARIS
jgi:glutamyl-Q tRNA(Asp) synthetase